MKNLWHQIKAHEWDVWDGALLATVAWMAIVMGFTIYGYAFA